MTTETADLPIESVYTEIFGEDDNPEPEAEAPEGGAVDDEVDGDAPDEEGDESPDADEDDSDAGEDDTDEDDDAPAAAGAPDVVEVSDDDVIRLPDGSEVKVSEAALRHADYTRKTQEVAEKRREVEQLEENLREREDLLVRFNESWTEDPVGLVQNLVRQVDDPTLFTAQLLKRMADAEVLQQEFVDLFGIQKGEVAQVAEKGQEHDRISKVEQRLDREERERQEAAQREEVIETFQRQWQNVIDSAGLEFESLEDEQAELRQVLQFAVDNEITNLEKAYGAYAWEREQQQRRERAESERAAAKAATTQKKRAARAMSPRSSATRTGGKRPPVSDEEAIGDAFDALLAAGS